MPAGPVNKEMAITDNEITWMVETGIVEVTDLKKWGKKKREKKGREQGWVRRPRYMNILNLWLSFLVIFLFTLWRKTCGMVLPCVWWLTGISVFGSNGSVKILKDTAHILFSHYPTVSMSTEDLGLVVVIQESILAWVQSWEWWIQKCFSS